MATIFYIYFSLISFVNNSQVQNITTTERIDTLNLFAFNHRQSHKNEALAAANLADSLSRKIFYKSGQTFALVNLIILHANRNEDDFVIRHLHDIDGNVKNPPEVQGYLLVAAGNSHVNLGLEAKAKKYYEEAIEYFKQIEDIQNLIEVYIDAGSKWAARAFYVEGLTYFKKAYELALKHESSGKLPEIYRYFANIYNKLENSAEAKSFAWKNLNDPQTQEDNEKIGDGYLTLAGIYAVNDRYDSAVHYYRKSLIFYDSANSVLGKTYSYINLAEVFNSMNLTDSAKVNLNLARKYLPVSNAYKRLSAYINYQLAKIYKSEGDIARAENALSVTIEFARQASELEFLRDAYELLSQIKETSGLADSALFYYKQYEIFHDSIYNISTERKFSNLRVQLETIEKEREIEALNQALSYSRVRNIAIITVLVLLVLAGYFGFKYLRSESKRKSLDLENSELIRKSIEEKLEIQSQELADYTFNMTQKNRFMEELEKSILEFKSKTDLNTQKALNKILRTMQFNRSNEKDWEHFNKYFGNVHKDFFNKLKTNYPLLSASDLRHCALIKMNLSLKETAEIMSIHPNSVKTVRYRMKKKMNLDETENLNEVMATL